MQYTIDGDASKITENLEIADERACAAALAAHGRQRKAALTFVLGELETVAWDCGEGHDSGEDISENWDVAARGLIKDMHEHGWGAEQVNALITALVRVRLENV